jgi:hypothetical protein
MYLMGGFPSYGGLYDVERGPGREISTDSEENVIGASPDSPAF